MLLGLISGSISFWHNVVLLVSFVVGILIALILHEVAHAWTAYKCGDPSAKIAGRITLNPIKHLDLLGTLCILFAPIGWAKPVPVNPFNYRNFRKGNFYVSIAGVTVNFILAIVFSLCFFFIDKYVGWAAATENLGLFLLYNLFFFAMIINICLMLFNLLPIYPLDGYNMLVSFTKPTNRYMQFMRQYSMPVFLIVICILMFTGVMGTIVYGIRDGLLWFWGLIF